jgi:hypothetical protein
MSIAANKQKEQVDLGDEIAAAQQKMQAEAASAAQNIANELTEK